MFDTLLDVSSPRAAKVEGQLVLHCRRRRPSSSAKPALQHPSRGRAGSTLFPRGLAAADEWTPASRIRTPACIQKTGQCGPGLNYFGGTGSEGLDEDDGPPSSLEVPGPSTTPPDTPHFALLVTPCLSSLQPLKHRRGTPPLANQRGEDVPATPVVTMSITSIGPLQGSGLVEFPPTEPRSAPKRRYPHNGEARPPLPFPHEYRRAGAAFGSHRTLGVLSHLPVPIADYTADGGADLSSLDTLTDVWDVLECTPQTSHGASGDLPPPPSTEDLVGGLPSTSNEVLEMDQSYDPPLESSTATPESSHPLPVGPSQCPESPPSDTGSQGWEGTVETSWTDDGSSVTEEGRRRMAQRSKAWEMAVGRTLRFVPVREHTPTKETEVVRASKAWVLGRCEGHQYHRTRAIAKKRKEEYANKVRGAKGEGKGGDGDTTQSPPSPQKGLPETAVQASAGTVAHPTPAAEEVSLAIPADPCPPGRMEVALNGRGAAALPSRVTEEGANQRQGEEGAKQQQGEEGAKQQQGEEGAKQQQGEEGVKQQQGEEGAKQQQGEEGAKQQQGEDEAPCPRPIVIATSAATSSTVQPIVLSTTATATPRDNTLLDCKKYERAPSLANRRLGAPITLSTSSLTGSVMHAAPIPRWTVTPPTPNENAERKTAFHERGDPYLVPSALEAVRRVEDGESKDQHEFKDQHDEFKDQRDEFKDQRDEFKDQHDQHSEESKGGEDAGQETTALRSPFGSNVWSEGSMDWEMSDVEPEGDREHMEAGEGDEAGHVESNEGTVQAEGDETDEWCLSKGADDDAGESEPPVEVADQSQFLATGYQNAGPSVVLTPCPKEGTGDHGDTGTSIDLSRFSSIASCVSSVADGSVTSSPKLRSTASPSRGGSRRLKAERKKAAGISVEVMTDFLRRSFKPQLIQRLTKLFNDADADHDRMLDSTELTVFIRAVYDITTAEFTEDTIQRDVRESLEMYGRKTPGALEVAEVCSFLMSSTFSHVLREKLKPDIFKQSCRPHLPTLKFPSRRRPTRESDGSVLPTPGTPTSLLRNLVPGHSSQTTSPRPVVWRKRSTALRLDQVTKALRKKSKSMTQWVVLREKIRNVQLRRRERICKVLKVQDTTAKAVIRWIDNAREAARERKYEMVKNEMLKILKTSGIHTEVKSGQHVSYRHQANLEMIDAEAIRTRGALKENRDIIQSIMNMWVRLPKCPPPFSDLVDQQIYQWMSTKLVNGLLPSGERIKALGRLDEEWRKDSKGHWLMDFQHFYDAMFHFLDVWCDTTDPKEYTDLARTVTRWVGSNYDFIWSIKLAERHYEEWKAEKTPKGDSRLDPPVFPFVDRRGGGGKLKCAVATSQLSSKQLQELRAKQQKEAKEREAQLRREEQLRLQKEREEEQRKQQVKKELMKLRHMKQIQMLREKENRMRKAQSAVKPQKELQLSDRATSMH